MQKRSVNETTEVIHLIYLNNDLLWVFFELRVLIIFFLNKEKTGIQFKFNNLLTSYLNFFNELLLPIFIHSFFKLFIVTQNHCERVVLSSWSLGTRLF